jgi:hypothetical protein
MRALFAEDATYIEPFSGARRTHKGKDAILATLRQGWQTPLPEMRIEIERVDLEGASLRALWTCHSPGLPGGYGQGENLFSLNNEGQIQRLETRLRTASQNADVDEYIARLDGWQAEAAKTIRTAILGASPGLIETWKWSQPVYEVTGPVCWLKAHKAHITVGFWRGVELQSVEPRLETSGKKMAHMKIRSGEKIDSAAIQRLVQAGVALNPHKGNPAKA